MVKFEFRESFKMDDILYNEVLNWCKIEKWQPNKDVTKSESNKRASKILESTVEFKEGQYRGGFLWKNNANLPKNFLV